MTEWIDWLFKDPLHYGLMLYAIGVGTGIIVGRRLSVAKIEIERDNAIEDLNAIKRTIEIVKPDTAAPASA